MFNHVNHGITLADLTADTQSTGRTYQTPEGKKYPSVTTVLSLLSADKIQEWRKRVGEEEANKISQQASTRGTSVHTLAENYINNLENWHNGEMPANLFSFNQLRPILDKNLNNVWFQEAPLYSDIFECAGRVDCIAEWEGELSIVDFKTARKPKKEEWITNYFIQTAFYAAAFYERTGIPIKQGVITITVDHSEPQIFKVRTHDYLKHFMAVRAKYRELKGV